jgi:hypothetical protein
MMVATQNLAHPPVGKTLIETLTDQMPAATTVIGTLALAMSGQLTPAAQRVVDLLKQLPNLGTTGGTGSRSGGARKAASGGFGQAGVPQWVGEQGRELYVEGLTGGVIPHTVSEFIAAMMPNMAPLVASVAAAGGGGGGSHQSISVDRMSLFNARDEQDVVQRLAFLMPNGR